jgi:glucose dehydrogenase
VTDGRRQPAAVIGAKILLIGTLAWGVWRVLRAETGE